MKKTLLFFLLLFTNIFYAQISNLEGCQNYPKFDLTLKNAELIGNLNPAVTNVSYHLSLADANNNVNAISDPTAYNSPTLKTIYARINSNGTITTNYFNLTFGIPVNVVPLQTILTCGTAYQENILLYVTGGTSPYLYSLDLGQTYSFLRPVHLDPGDYTILVKDIKNCRADTPVFIRVEPSVPLIATATVTEGVNCGDKDSVTITASGGQGTYQYSFEGVHFSDLNTTKNLTAGTHTLYVQDQNGCTASTTVEIKNYKSTLTSTVTVTPISCLNKGSFTVQGVGGKTPYQYSLDRKPFESKNVFNNLVPGTYTINTKDATGCETSLSVNITSYTPLVLQLIKKDLNCFGDNNGEIEAVASGGISPFKFSLKSYSGELLVNKSSVNKFNNLPMGQYVVEVLDAGGCVVNVPIQINQPTVLMSTIAVDNQTISVSATGGTANYEYSLDTRIFQPNNIFTNVIYGIHELFVRDQNGCVVSQYVTIDPPAPVINGQKILNVEFKPGQTLGDLVIEGLNIKWYSNKSSTSKKTSKSTDTSLPPTTVLVDGVTYYASQTINGIESTERLAVTAKLSGSLSNEDFVLPNFRYYPNPVQHTLTIDNTATIEEIEILSVSGKSILNKKINSYHSEIDLSHVASGFYFLKVKAEGKVKTIKILKK